MPESTGPSIHTHNIITSSPPLVRVARRTCPSYKYWTDQPCDCVAARRSGPRRRRDSKGAPMQTARHAPRLRRSEAMGAPPLPSAPPRGGGPASRAASLVGKHPPSARQESPAFGAVHLRASLRPCNLAANARLLMRTVASRSRHVATPPPPPLPV